MRAFRAATLTDLHDKLCKEIVNSSAEKLDVVSSVDVQMHDVMAEAQSMEWAFDLKRLWLTPSRWTMMCNQYVDAMFLQEWIEKSAKHLGTSKRGIAHMRFKEVKPRGGKSQGNKETRRWGSCMLGLSYKAVPHPQINFHSRTSYLGYLSGMDLTVAWVCARYLGEAIGLDPSDMKFVWFNEAVQFHNFKSMAWMLCHPKPEEALRYRRLLIPTDDELSAEDKEELNQCVAIRLSRVWLQKLLLEDIRGDSYGVTRYNTYRRIRRRFHTEVMGLPYAKQFEGYSYYHAKDKVVVAGGAEVGQEKEFFSAYHPLPHTYSYDLTFDKQGVGQMEKMDLINPGSDEEEEEDEG